MSKLEMYDRAFITAMRSVPEDYDSRTDTRELEKAIFYGVKLISQESDPQTVENLYQQFKLAEGILGIMTLLTPRKFTELFPIKKEYDGNRWGTKDYFTTVSMIEKHGWDTSISAPDDFLWDYVNRDTTKFMVKYLSLASNIRRSQGKLGIMEEWAAQHNIPLYRLHTAPGGKQFMVDSSGRSVPVSKPKPKHLKIVKNRKVSRHE